MIYEPGEPGLAPDELIGLSGPVLKALIFKLLVLALLFWTIGFELLGLYFWATPEISPLLTPLTWLVLIRRY